MIDLIRYIAKSRCGISQSQILGKKGLSSGGTAIRRLKQLEEAGFILSFIPHGHQQKGIFYKIIDEYTLFYLDWIEPFLSSIRHQDASSNYWLSKAKSPGWKSWAGLAFEAVCHKHVAQIRKALSIDSSAEIGSWQYIPRSAEGKKGTQIDLLFDQPDDVIMICEIKHSDSPYIIDKEYANNLRHKINIYRQQTRTKKMVFLAMITSGGLKPSKYSKELVSREVGLDDLFSSF